MPLLAARATRAFHDYMPIRAAPRGEDRVYRQLRLRPAARRVPDRPAHLSRPEQPNHADRADAGSAIIGERAAPLAEAGAQAAPGRPGR